MVPHQPLYWLPVAKVNQHRPLHLLLRRHLLQLQHQQLHLLLNLLLSQLLSQLRQPQQPNHSVKTLRFGLLLTTPLVRVVRPCSGVCRSSLNFDQTFL